MSGAENADISLLSGVNEGQLQQEREEEDELSCQHSERDGDVEDEQGDTSSPGTPPPSASSSGYYGEHDALYGAGLRRLREALEAKYNLDNISYVSYALAVDVHCTAARTHPGEGTGPAVCLLADRNRVAGEFYGSNYTFYPLGFHPAYGNFSSDRPPAFLDSNLFTVMKENMSHQNQGADVLSFGFFQGYSNLKRSIRHRPDDLLASHGLATGALTIPSTEAQRTARLQGKQQRLLAQLRGQLTPDNPGASTPFARERQRIEAAVQAKEYAFRFEQVISIDAPRLVRQRRNFHTVLQPIFQLMRLFLKEKQLYAGVLRRFPPEIFPGMLVAFAKVLEAAMAEMDCRFREGGSKGLGMALSEGVAALDRLGNFCFTGDPRVLPSKVMRLLGTMDSLRTCGWPFISPRMLDIREGRGLVNLVGWPQLSNGRPVLMHVASLEYHYNRSVAANRHSQLWFAELGGRSIDGVHRMTSFLNEVFRDLWVPETVAFICQQVRRGLNRGLRSGGGGGGGSRNDGDLNNAGSRAMVALVAWEEGDTPFKLSRFEKLSAEVLKFDDRSIDDSKIVLKTRRDFAEEVYVALMEGGKKGHAGVESMAPTRSTWPSILRAAIEHTKGGFATRAQWVSGIAAAMVSTKIEWVPGSHRRRLTHQQVVQLVGAATPATVLAARPNSLKRRALEAEARMAAEPVDGKRARIRQRIDLGYEIPFKQVPDIVHRGFNELKRLFAKGDQRVLSHYCVAYCCLAGCLGDPLCDLMLILTLTITASSATPEVQPNTKVFSVATKRRDPALLAANMVMRMLWFLRPKEFPWEKDDGQVLRVTEMIKKIEHKGVNNRLL
ncbi:hypothetical protein EDB81DRAFT_930064 [Dactylonectria macrodidyma]|uniref:Uncharacterized protein n=1 Tax=Dactylonectria macrodidyma TaxID=307937 RepID=A0A9P9CYG1_9HYPO|nr:hypothetical protein EDB81DRAFT_930064 [Dactylonectria macrodidyma]